MNGDFSWHAQQIVEAVYRAMNQVGECSIEVATFMQRPSMYLRLKPEFLSGSQNCRSPHYRVEHGSVVGVGASADEACRDFDAKWGLKAS